MGLGDIWGAAWGDRDTQQNTQTCPGLDTGLSKEKAGVSMCMALAPRESTLPPNLSSSLENQFFPSSLSSCSGILGDYILGGGVICF